MLVSTILGSLLGLGLARLRFRGRGATETLLLVPMVTPEIVMGLALLLFFLQLFDAHGSLAQLWVAHITFCISYVAVVVRARAASMNPQLEEAARDLGASAWGAFRYVTLPLILPAVIAGALLAFSLSFDDYVVTTFNSGVGGSTLPLYIYGKIKFGVTPEINAISTIIVAVTALAILAAWRLGAFRGEAAGRSSDGGRRRPRPDAVSRGVAASRPGGRTGTRGASPAPRGRRTAGDVALEGVRLAVLRRRDVVAEPDRPRRVDAVVGIAVDRHQVERVDARLLVRVAAGDPALRPRAALLQLADVPVLAVRQVPERDRVGRVEAGHRDRRRARTATRQTIRVWSGAGRLQAVDEQVVGVDREERRSARPGSSRSGARRPASSRPSPAGRRDARRRSPSSRRSRRAPSSRPATARSARSRRRGRTASAC